MSIVTIAEVKALGRISTDSQDTLIQSLIDAAESFVEKFCDTSLTSASRTETIDGGGYYLMPSVKPITAVASVTEDSTLIPSTDYSFEQFGIYHKEELPWREGKKKYTVVYTGGLATVPAGLKLAIKQMALRAYLNFEAKRTSGEPGNAVEWQSLWSGNDISAILEQYSYKAILE
jgi:hypothetical protein